MAAFIAKQVVGKQLESVKGALGDKEEKDEKDKKGDGGDGDDEEEEAIAEARREEEAKRKEKHRKMEEEREGMRQEIRDKYGIKKRESPMEDPSLDGRLGRKNKGHEDDTMATAASTATVNNPESDAGALPQRLENLTSRVKELPEKVMSTVTDVSDKCRPQ